MKKVLILFVALFLAVPAFAEQVTGSVLVKYDLDSTTVVYPIMKGAGGRPFSSPISGNAAIKTTGSSATVAAVTASTYPFLDVVVGDILIVNETSRLVIARASADSITVDTAIDLSALTGGYTFGFYHVIVGTGADGDGWFHVGDLTSMGIALQIDQMVVTGGIDVRVECKAAAIGAAPIQVWPYCLIGVCGTYQNISGTAGIADRGAIGTDVGWQEECRVGLKIHTADDGGDLTTDREQVTIAFSGIRR